MHCVLVVRNEVLNTVLPKLSHVLGKWFTEAYIVAMQSMAPETHLANYESIQTAKNAHEFKVDFSPDLAYMVNTASARKEQTAHAQSGQHSPSRANIA